MASAERDTQDHHHHAGLLLLANLTTIGTHRRRVTGAQLMRVFLLRC
jgi:hypothetical protein